MSFLSRSLAGLILAIGLASGEARATFLVQVTSQLTTAGATTVGTSSTQLASFLSSPSDLDLSGGINPVHQVYGQTSVASSNTAGSDHFDINYTWKLTFAHVVNGAATGGTGIATVTGELVGDVSAFGNTLINIYKTFAPTIVTVDGVRITLSLDAYTPPGTPPSTSPDFSVGMVGSSGTIGGLPEPSTASLLGVAGVTLLARSVRRRARRFA